MKWKWWVPLAPVTCIGILGILFGIFLLALLLIKALWAWTVPDLFPGAVESNLVARSVSWFTAFKLAIVVALFAAAVRQKRGSRS